MIVLDTDVLSIFESSSQNPRTRDILLHLEQSEEVATTIVCVEQQMKGWVSAIAKKKLVLDQLDAYRRLQTQLRNYCQMRILGFDELAAVKFQELNKAKTRVGAMDLKIAAIALAHAAKVLTGNVRHFRQVPGLVVLDWYRL